MSALAPASTRVSRQGFTGAQGTVRAERAPAAILRPLALLLALALAAGCVPTETATPVAAAPVLRSSPDAGPGPNPITSARASAVFTALCVSQRTPEGTASAAAADGFVRNTTFGTYYHPRDNLSVKLIDGDCSMVFASRAPEGELRTALTSLAAGNRPVTWNGQRLGLYNVRIAAR